MKFKLTHDRADFWREREYDLAGIMPNSAQQLKTIGEFIDRVEQIREELLALQRSMEKLEPAQTISSTDDGKDT